MELHPLVFENLSVEVFEDVGVASPFVEQQEDCGAGFLLSVEEAGVFLRHQQVFYTLEGALLASGNLSPLHKLCCPDQHPQRQRC
jgi:hypothetical protein